VIDGSPHEKNLLWVRKFGLHEMARLHKLARGVGKADLEAVEKALAEALEKE
jgi:hypothetical protein